MFMCFNPRPREGSDDRIVYGFYGPDWFQSAPPRRERFSGGPVITLGIKVSIRAPAKGAMPGVPQSRGAARVSIRAPAKGAILPAPRGARPARVSIRAPAKGAMALKHKYRPGRNKFQSAPPRRERFKEGLDLSASDKVSIRAPAKGAMPVVRLSLTDRAVSIRAPAKGAICAGCGCVSPIWFQSAPPRRER